MDGDCELFHVFKCLCLGRAERGGEGGRDNNNKIEEEEPVKWLASLELAEVVGGARAAYGGPRVINWTPNSPTPNFC